MWTSDFLRAARADRYHQVPHRRVRTEDEALSFLNQVGLCLLFSAKDVELPSLWGALCGDNRPIPKNHDDHALGLAWHWKDTLPTAGQVLYGRFLRKRPVFISLDLAPHFYALSPNYENPAEDYLQDYQDGRLSIEAKQVYEVLLGQGALPTSRLRREAGLAGKDNAARFDRALTELQSDFRITKVAISDANRWGYCYVYDLLFLHFPEIVAAARDITGRQARETILVRYLGTVVAATPQQVCGLFGWMPGDVDRMVAHLEAEGRIRSKVQIEGLAGEYLTTTMVPS